MTNTNANASKTSATTQAPKLLNVPSHLTTKGEIAEYLYSPSTNPAIEAYDCAVPHYWAQAANSRLTEFDSDIARHVVTVYYKDKSVRIMPLTDYALRALATIATNNL